MTSKNIQFLTDLDNLDAPTNTVPTTSATATGVKQSSIAQQEQALDALFGLLPQEAEQQLQAERESSPEAQQAYEQAQAQKQMFDAWSDREPPSDLLTKTMARLGLS
ncbi:MAG: hypothetical protein AAGJ35_10110 [Myxococcota bacterium]